MKTLIINGSPRKNGDTINLVNEMVKNLDGEVRIINTYYDKISPCIDCRYCWDHSICSIKDGMQEIYGLINEVDNIILASPIYFSELSGSLLSFASRFQLYYASRVIRKEQNSKLKTKNGVLILVAGGDTNDLSKVIGTANTLFKHIGVKSIGNVMSLHTDSFNDVVGIRAKDDIMALSMAREMAIKLNEMSGNKV